MTLPGILRPVLDAVAPEDREAPGRRIRSAAAWLAVATWLLPAYAPLGTDTVTKRSILCAAFLAAAVTAHFRARFRWARLGFAAAAGAAAALVFAASGGSVWGLGFLLFSAVVIGASEARRRFVAFADPPADPDPRPPVPRLVPRILGAYAWIGCSVLVVTGWAGQLMMVPTGSMQPTIMGGRQVAGEPRSGDYLFVDNFSYLFRDPRRWEIVVFEFPLFRERYFVKRVVGLPSEHLEIRDGDIWIDGRIAKKPPVVQHTMWQEQFPRAGPHGPVKDVVPAWLQADAAKGGDWRKPVPGEIVGRTSGAEPTFAYLTRRIDAADVRLAFDVRPDRSDSVVCARITSRGVPVELRIPTADSSQAEFLVGRTAAPRDLADTNLFALGTGAFHRVELTVLDGDAWWSFDGTPRRALPVEGRTRGATRVEIGVRGEAAFRALRVDADIAYTDGGGAASYDVPEDGFFFLGDNVAQSDDSRKWTVDVIRTGTSEFRAPQRLLTEMGAEGAVNMRQDGANWAFVDVDGVPRSVPREGTSIAPAPAPFARREHLVGRAIMVLFPWTVAEAGFRPRLLP